MSTLNHFLQATERKHMTKIPAIKELMVCLVQAFPYYYFTNDVSYAKDSAAHNPVSKRCSCAASDSSVGKAEECKRCSSLAISEYPIIMFSKRCPLWLPTLNSLGPRAERGCEPARCAPTDWATPWVSYSAHPGLQLLYLSDADISKGFVWIK